MIKSKFTLLLIPNEGRVIGPPLFFTPNNHTTVRFKVQHIGPPIGGAAANARADGQDTLWDTIEPAAMDYLTQQCNRYFGENVATIYLDKSELVVGEVYDFHKAFYPVIFEDATEEFNFEYLNTSDEYVSLTEDTHYKIHKRKYPVGIELLPLDTPIEDESDEEYGHYRITLPFGEFTYPPRFKQAFLLLTGHFYNQREAEVIGAITTEVKMGVDRLIGSLRNYKDVPTQ